ncbi:MAG TPA: hypothetical protein VIM12_05725 [Noviherbaspirillum sp.]|jgi:hypothetical protein|uniref:hypothetical protein n=1 Tax=Noviherbaspirillum sp. TaxID=1926288 RepID=UPI002F922123
MYKPQFDLDKQLVKIVNINSRTEKHGDDNVLAIDLQIEARMPNDSLSMFSSTLKTALYFKDESVQGDLVDDKTHAPNLRNPLLGPLKWGAELEHMQLRVHHGVRGEDDIVFSESKINKFKFICQEGGTVVIAFRAQVHPTEKDAAKLLTLIQSEVHVSVISEISEEGLQGDLKEAA